MLIPNLSVLLAQRRLTITRAAQDTGLSRTTLTALCAATAKGIQFDTLDTLCQYLKIAPGDFFLYRPFDLSVACEGRLGASDLPFTIRRAGRREERARLRCDARLLPGGDGPDALRVRLTLPENDPSAEELAALLQALPTPILDDLEFQILRAFDPNLPPRRADYAPELLWPWQD